MPTYGYACQKCRHEFDEFQSITANPLRKCPECGKLALKRLIGTGAGIIFKGSGFYETDYRSESYRKAAESDKGGSASKSEDKKQTKSDKKAGSTEAKSSTSEKKKSA
ncbi:MAG: FmdB family zinc ribbon protein [Planctomycetota bacterium]|jgi:putative FmdB family regulatory protein